MRTIWIGAAADYVRKGDETYPVHKDDKIIQRVVWGNCWAEIFAGGFSIIERRMKIFRMIFNEKMKRGDFN